MVYARHRKREEFSIYNGTANALQAHGGTLDKLFQYDGTAMGWRELLDHLVNNGAATTSVDSKTVFPRSSINGVGWLEVVLMTQALSSFSEVSSLRQPPVPAAAADGEEDDELNLEPGEGDEVD